MAWIVTRRSRVSVAGEAVEQRVSFEGSGAPGTPKTHVRVRLVEESRIELTEQTDEE